MLSRFFKVGCVFLVIIVSMLPHAEIGRNASDHREDAPHFILTVSHYLWMLTERLLTILTINTFVKYWQIKSRSWNCFPHKEFITNWFFFVEVKIPFVIFQLQVGWEKSFISCGWRMLETKRVGDNFEMTVTDFWESQQHDEKSHQYYDSVTNTSL